MKKFVSLLFFMLLFTVSAFCQSVTDPILDSNIWVTAGTAIVGALLGHFAIPTKWASPVKYVLIAFKGVTWLLEKVNSTNNGEPKLKAKDVQPPVQPPTIKVSKK